MRELPRYFVDGLRCFSLVGGFCVAFIGLLLPAVAEDKSPPAAAATTAPAASKAFTGEIVLGKADAPVTVIEYASMTCPHCANFHTKILPALKEKYVDTGKVKFIFREFPLDGVALRASMMARCGGEAKVHGYLDILFQQQAQWAGAEKPLEALGRIAQLGGMSRDDFEACVTDEALMKQLVQTRQDGADKFKIQSTPSFIIDGKTHAGDMEVEDFSKLIDPLLPDA